LTAGHRTLPLGTLVRVTNLENRRTVIVRINDRSSAVGTRIIDLTPRAAAVIGLQGIATVPVKLEVIGASAARLTPAGADPRVK
jgi:rare lipoprotein A